MKEKKNTWLIFVPKASYIYTYRGIDSRQKRSALLKNKHYIWLQGKNKVKKSRDYMKRLKVLIKRANWACHWCSIRKSLYRRYEG